MVPFSDAAISVYQPVLLPVSKVVVVQVELPLDLIATLAAEEVTELKLFRSRICIYETANESSSRVTISAYLPLSAW